jgi:hypothetical protein
MKAEIVIQKETGRVIKICRSHKEFKKELFIYERYPTFAPKLLDHNGTNTIAVQYIEGMPIGDLIQPDFSAIAGLFIELHQLSVKKDKCICLIDSNPKNFLYDPETHKYFMLDFSEWEYDYPEVDLIHFLLFWASIYRSEKFAKILHDFIDSYTAEMPLNKIEWEILVPEVIFKFDTRRKKYNRSESLEISEIQKNRELITRL